jgi:hypothetical protein
LKKYRSRYRRRSPYDEQEQRIGSIGFAKDLRIIRRRDQLVTLAEIAIGLSQ